MASLLLAILLLPAPTIPPGDRAVPLPLLRSIELDAETLLADPSLLAADTLALAVTIRREAYYKLSERDEVLAAGKLLPGPNSLRFTRPGLSARSQSVLLVLEILADETAQQKFIRLQVTVGGRTAAAVPAAALTGSFGLEMFHSGRLIGFRRKRMQDLVKLTTGPAAPVVDPLSGASFRPQPSGQSVPVLGMAMALAKYLAGKKIAKRMKDFNAESQKRSLSLTIARSEPDGQKREIPIKIELQVE